MWEGIRKLGFCKRSWISFCDAGKLTILTRVVMEYILLCFSREKNFFQKKKNTCGLLVHPKKKHWVKKIAEKNLLNTFMNPVWTSIQIGVCILVCNFFIVIFPITIQLSAAQNMRNCSELIDNDANRKWLDIMIPAYSAALDEYCISFLLISAELFLLVAIITDQIDGHRIILFLLLLNIAMNLVYVGVNYGVFPQFDAYHDLPEDPECIEIPISSECVKFGVRHILFTNRVKNVLLVNIIYSFTIVTYAFLSFGRTLYLCCKPLDC